MTLSETHDFCITEIEMREAVNWNGWKRTVPQFYDRNGFGAVNKGRLRMTTGHRDVSHGCINEHTGYEGVCLK
jgi:hypothetical protein